jgi:hypothetical protein
MNVGGLPRRRNALYARRCEDALDLLAIHLMPTRLKKLARERLDRGDIAGDQFLGRHTSDLYDCGNVAALGVRDFSGGIFRPAVVIAIAVHLHAIEPLIGDRASKQRDNKRPQRGSTRVTASTKPSRERSAAESF